MSTSKERILARLRTAQGREIESTRPSSEEAREAARAWQAKQPRITDLAERFMAEQASTGGEVRRVAGWDALPDVVTPWLAERKVASVMTGREPRLDPLREALAADGRFDLQRFDHPVDEGANVPRTGSETSGVEKSGGEKIHAQRDAVFAVDCGITTSLGGIAETGSAVVVPTPAEPRLLSLAVPVHLVVVEVAALVPTLNDWIATGRYQDEVPTNLVLISGASRTADIELVLAMGVHGPKTLLVALIE